MQISYLKPLSSSSHCELHRHGLVPCGGGSSVLVIFQWGRKAQLRRSNTQLVPVFSQLTREIGSQRRRGQVDFKRWPKAKRPSYCIFVPRSEASPRKFVGGTATSKSALVRQPGQESGDVTSVKVDRLLEQGSPVYGTSTETVTPMLPSTLRFAQLGPLDQAFFLLGFIACTTTGALSALLFTAIPTLNSMRRAAIAMEKLADVAREELPPTMAAIRLSGMEISDLTLELNDLSHEISDGVRSSARAVHAAEVGIRRMGVVAASQTFAMLQEQARYPVAVVKPAVLGAAESTRQAIEVARNVVIQLATHPTITGWLGRGKKQKRANAVVDGVPPNNEVVLERSTEELPAAATSMLEQ